MHSISTESFFFQAEDGIRDVERSRGLGDVYKRQFFILGQLFGGQLFELFARETNLKKQSSVNPVSYTHLTLPTKRIV